MIDEKFIKNRISDLRERKGVSEHRMSMDLGRSKGYVQSITRGGAMPSMGGFLEICGYLGVTPSAFFDEGESLPQLRESFIGKARALGEDDMKMLIPLMDRMAGEGAA